MSRVVPLLAVIGLLLSGCATSVGYLAKQGRYLLRDSTGTRSIASVLSDPSTADSTRVFLNRVGQIKRYAVDVVGLKDNGNYTRYKRIERDHLVDVVSASDAVSFTPYSWRYPFLGDLPYRGFYEKADADAEAARLRKDGWDVITRPVDAFSTLGFTKDPLYSFMEKYSVFEIASLVIHEQTHATLFLKGQSQFNEELASFVGDEGAFEWILSRYGADSEEYLAARDAEADQQAFIRRLQELTHALDAVYKGDGSREEKLAGKAELISEWNAWLLADRETLFRTETYRALGPLSLNNAYLSLFSLYTDDVPLLRMYWEKICGSDLRRFMEAAKELAKRGDVTALMRRELGVS